MVDSESNTINGSANQPNLEQLMQIGIQTARAGQKPNARVIFQQVLDQDKENERAWLWMAAVAENPRDRLRYLTTVLNLNPNNETALRQIEKMKQSKETSNTKVIRYGFMGLGVIFVLLVCAIIMVIVL